MAHPVNGLDDVVHQRARLGILAILNETTKVDFGYLKDALELTDGNLSRHLTVLEEANLVDVEKGYEGKRPRTWVKITKLGKKALAYEVEALKTLVRRVEQTR
ncbi:MAG TPA: transcriptional regulator [Actinomycetota bacterium]|nr:transcriptional regulator [Actinomycetota bacterium]